MSERNKATLKKANAAISAGDHDGFLAHCTEDTEWTFVGERTLKGKAAVRRWMKTAYAEPPRFKVAHLIAEGNFVVAMGDITLKDKDGRDARHSYCDVWRFRRGKMAGLMAFVVQTKTNAKGRSRRGPG
jgi:ketosteroid isomerase-like protein